MGPSHGVQSLRNRLLQRGSPWCHKPCQKTYSSVGSCLHESAGPGRSLLQRGAPHTVIASFMHLSTPVRGPFMGYRWRSAPPWISLDCKGDSLPHHCLSSRAAREDTLLRHLEHLLPLPSSLTLVSTELFLSHLLTPLSQLPCYPSFFPFLKYVITEVLPPLLVGLALARGGSILEPAGTGFIRHGGSFLQLLIEATPIAPPLPKPCHTNP